MNPIRLHGILAFLQASEKLKDTLRSGFTSSGASESTAEHTWRLCLMVMLFEKELPDIDFTRLLKLCIIHDLGEAISGDIPAIYQTVDDNKDERERRDLEILCAPLEGDLKDELMALWDEYTAANTPEAVLAKGFDKLETILQHVIGKNPPDFDYEFNIRYGVAHTERHPLLQQIRELVDAATRSCMS
ncbi:MAG: HD domain-containing protein [Hyphomicrobiales bacterium]